jgi:hypothetical protein
MKKLLLFLCSLVATAAMQAQIIHVPGDYPTIQQGINHATQGDTVLVAEGTYYEQINFKGKKPLMVASQFLLDGDTNHIANTIIDGNHLTNMDSASVVYIVSGEDTTSILCGFTIQHGKGTYTPDNVVGRSGGGIWISGAGAKIIYNRITHNTLDDTQPVNGNSTDGAGIATKFEDADYWLVIGNNTIDNNTCISKYDYALGGGIGTFYNSKIIDNVVSYNSCSGMLNAVAGAGGIDCEQDISGPSAATVIEHNTITHNLTQSQNNYANAAGVFIGYIQGVFSHNEVAYNTVITGSTEGGTAGLLLYQPDPGSVVSNNVFKGNVSNLWAGGLALENDVILDNMVLVENNYFFDNQADKGGACSVFSIPVTLQNNVFNGNLGSFGGALYLWNDLGVPGYHLATLINNSFSGNIATYVGGAIYSLDLNPFILNSIFWQDWASSGKEIYANGGTMEIAYSDIDLNLIQGTYIDGGGLINVDPLFEYPETLRTYHDSPCVDAGIEIFTCNHGLTFEAPGYDILGNPRPQGAGYDMGAYDVDYWPVGIGKITNYGLRITNWPNPIIESTTFLYTLKESSQIRLQIFNSFGQMIAEPVNTTQAKGEQNVQWNAGSLPAGIYYYRLQAGNRMGSGKMVKY